MPEAGETPKRISRRTLLKVGGAAAVGVGIATAVKPDLLDKLISSSQKKQTTEPSKTQTSQKEKGGTEPKFEKNWPDNNHCLQAAVKSVLDTVLDKETSWDEVNKMTQYEDGLYSWDSVATVAVNEKIPWTKLLSVLDYKKFAEEGESYLRTLWSQQENWYKVQKQHASKGFVKEQQAAKKLIEKNLFQHTFVTQEIIVNLLPEHLLIALVDAGKLPEGKATSGHFVVLFGQDSERFVFHDPGLPPHPNWKVQKEQFMSAFQRSLIVVPRQKAVR